MKKLITSLFTIYSIGLGFSQGWQSQNIDLKSSFMDIAIVDSNNCYAVGWKGAVFKSTNGGNSWTPLQSGTTEHLTSVHVIGGVVYAVAPKDNKIIRSSDGQTFSSITLNGYNGAQVYFFNNQLGFVAGGQKGKLAKTTNGGDSWEIIETNYQSAIKKVFFVSNTNGFAIAHEISNNVAKSVILKTVDGGLNWTKINEQANTVLNDLYFTDSSYGYFAGNNGKLYRTTDGGTNCTLINTGTTATLNEVCFSDSYIGYVVGNRGTILKTVNRGATWQTLTSPKEYAILSASFQGNVGYLLTLGNLVLKTTNGGL